VRDYGTHRIEVTPRSVLTLYSADAPEVRARRVVLDRRGHVDRFERVEDGRLLRYEIAAAGQRLVARRAAATRPVGPASTGVAELPEGLALLQVAAAPGGPVESPGVVLRIDSRVGGAMRRLEAEFPRAILQRLVLGREVDPTPQQSMPGVWPLPAALAEMRSMMVLPPAARWAAPWEADNAGLPGEEDPLRLARALDRWWSATGERPPRAVVGVDGELSPQRWAAAPLPDEQALLLLPRDGFVGPMAGWRDALAEVWDASTVADALPDEPGAALVVLVSAESPAVFSRRLRELARDDRMRGRLLAAWCLSGPLREDLARSLLDEGLLAGLGVGEHSLVARRAAAGTLATVKRTLAAGDRRVEGLGGPFLWHF
jgi:hypothetical protein